MNWLDLIIILFLVLALIRGSVIGFVRQFFSTTGFVAGILLGAWLQSRVIAYASTVETKAVLSLVIFVACGLILLIVGEFIGVKIKNRLEKSKLINKADTVFGSLLGALTILLLVWLASSAFSKIPYEKLNDQINNSHVVKVLNKNLPSVPAVLTQAGHLINPNGFPQVFTGDEQQLSTDTPLPDLGNLNSAINKTKDSVVKISGQGCGGIVIGTGFVASGNLIVTNAHVVAGVKSPKVIDLAGVHQTTVLLFDPDLDIAILKTNGLAGSPLRLRHQLIEPGTEAVVLGYPESSGLTASPSVILNSISAVGRDIYNQKPTKRQIYSIKADVRQGNSGSPLIAADGSVIGVIFAESTFDAVGYALTMDQVIDRVIKAGQQTEAVATGGCAA